MADTKVTRLRPVRPCPICGKPSVQAFHPFTKAAQAKLPLKSVAPVDVEIFPTGARIRPGHRLRIAVQAFDVPHLLPVLPDLLGSLTVLTIHNSAKYPSRLTVPAVVRRR